METLQLNKMYLVVILLQKTMKYLMNNIFNQWKQISCGQPGTGLSFEQSCFNHSKIKAITAKGVEKQIDFYDKELFFLF